MNEIGIKSRVWRGWRVAYRLKEPEREGVAEIEKRLAAKMKLSVDRPFSTEVSRTKTPEQRKAAYVKSATLRQARAAAQKLAGIDPW